MKKAELRVSLNAFDEFVSTLMLNLPNVVALMFHDTGFGTPFVTVPISWVLFAMSHAVGAWRVTLTSSASDMNAVIDMFITNGLYWNVSVGVINDPSTIPILAVQPGRSSVMFSSSELFCP